MSTKLEREYPTIKKLGGEIYNVRRLAHPDVKEWSATNLSIGYHASTGYIGMFRSGNYVITERGEYTVTDRDYIRSRIYVGKINELTYKLEDIKELDVRGLSSEGELRRGLEDPKLFYRDGAWHFTAVTMEKTHTKVARMCVCRLSADLTKVVDFKKFPGIDASRPEKNWMIPHDENKNFDFIYAGNAIVKDGLVTHYLTDDEIIASLRGNSNLHLLDDGTYLAVVHRMWTRTIMGATIRHYVHFFSNYDQTGRLIKISKGFVFEHLGTEFAAGIVEQGDNFLISYGSKDVSCHVAKIKKNVVLKGLQPI